MKFFSVFLLVAAGRFFGMADTVSEDVLGKLDQKQQKPESSEVKSVKVSDKLWVSGYKNFIHNSGCSYYGKGDGHFRKDSKDSDIDCKICGGRNPIPVEKSVPTKLVGTRKKTSADQEEMPARTNYSENQQTSGIASSAENSVLPADAKQENQTNKATSESVESGGKQQSTSDTTFSSTETDSKGRTIHTGPRGGKYYINKNGNKTYVHRKK